MRAGNRGGRYEPAHDRLEHRVPAEKVGTQPPAGGPSHALRPAAPCGIARSVVLDAEVDTSLFAYTARLKVLARSRRVVHLPRSPVLAP